MLACPEETTRKKLFLVWCLSSLVVLCVTPPPIPPSWCEGRRVGVGMGVV